MTNYDDMIFQWNRSVRDYCRAHNIPNMNLKNLRQDDVYNYDLYRAYTNAKEAIAAYIKTPSSSLYAKEMLECLKKWYALIADSKRDRMSVRILPNGYLFNVFERIIERTK